MGYHTRHVSVSVIVTRDGQRVPPTEVLLDLQDIAGNQTDNDRTDELPSIEVPAAFGSLSGATIEDVRHKRFQFWFDVARWVGKLALELLPFFGHGT
jgi:hypothetical protein